MKTRPTINIQIESVEVMIRDAQIEEEYAWEKEENARLQNAYQYDEGGFCDGFMR